MSVVYTRCIPGHEEIIIGATDGSRSLNGSPELFMGGIRNYTDVILGVHGLNRGLVKASLHKQNINGNFYQIFGRLGEHFFTEHQVVEFAEKYNRLPVNVGCTTHLPLLVDKQELVVGLCMYSGSRLSVRIRRFSDDFVWNARFCHYFVFLQPAPPGI